MKKAKEKTKILHTPEMLGFGSLKGQNLHEALMKMRRDEARDS